MKNNWEDVPDNIKNTFDKLGIPEAEQKVLAGVGAQYESEMVYHSLKKEWDEQGLIFDSIEDGLKNHPDIFRKYYASVIPPADNKFAALSSDLPGHAGQRFQIGLTQRLEHRHAAQPFFYGFQRRCRHESRVLPGPALDCIVWP